MRSKLFRVLGWAATSLAVVLAVLYALHRRYLYRLPADVVPNFRGLSRESGLPADLLAELGAFQVDPTRRAPGPLVPKRAGTVRIGAFGDSFTFGAEVSPEATFPSQLAELFRADGLENVEVINLGTSWQGFAQITRLREGIQAGGEFDFVLLGPMCLAVDYERELTFNHTRDEAPHYLHGRYVLDGDGLRWIDPPGGRDGEARFDGYYRFLPAWAYLRYDSRAPSFLRALLPEGRALRNPFYYTRLGVADEGATLYHRLLRRWTAGRSQVVLVHLYEDVVRLAAEHRDLVAVGAGRQAEGFHLRRTRNHLSGAGNRLIAKMFHDILLDRQPLVIDELVASPEPRTRLAGSALAGSRSGEVMWGDTVLATLEDHDSGEVATFDGVGGLLFLASPAQSLANGTAWAQASPLPAGAPLEADLDCADGPRRIALGSVERLDGDGSLAVVKSPALLNGDELVPEALGVPRGQVRGGRVLLAGEPILTLVDIGQTWFPLRPLSGRLIRARPRPETLPRLEQLPRAASARLLFHGPREVALDLGVWTRAARELPWDDTGLRLRLRRDPENPRRALTVTAPDR